MLGFLFLILSIAFASSGNQPFYPPEPKGFAPKSNFAPEHSANNSKRLPDSLGEDVYIHLTPGSQDNSLELQKQIDAIDFNTGATNVHVHVNHGNFTFKHGILFHNWQQARGIYFAFTIDFEGDGTAASADGSGTIFNFPFSNSFWIGFQGAKGCKFHGITFQGQWHPTFKTSFEFYAGGGMGPLDFRNANYDPCAAIVFEPFGPKVPADGGYPGTDAYGKPWSGYYRGGGNGSTGCEVYDCKFIGTWIGIITSPSGQTPNAEGMHFHRLNFDINNANPIVGCQAQEKMNEVGPDIIDWGATSTFIQLGTYGAHENGHWDVHGVNIAGLVRQFVYDNAAGYYPIKIHDCFGETLGTFGYLCGWVGHSVTDCHFDMANPWDAAFHYIFPQINGYGTTYTRCTFRFYGGNYGNLPIQIWEHDGQNVFVNCTFYTVPVYNLQGDGSGPIFRDCFIGQKPYTQMSGKVVPIDSTAPGFSPSYEIKYSMVGKINQATIQGVGNELKRVAPNMVLVAFDLRAIQVCVAGVVTSVDPAHNTINISYVPPNIVSGQKYYLYLWKSQLTP